jgi:GntR family transcriptional regulator, vanillate catabolism transcriptional regulator
MIMTAATLTEAGERHGTDIHRPGAKSMKQSATVAEKALQSPPSQTVKALLSLRDLILKGALAPGERLSELVIVERLGVSRTPLRAALIRLEEEGLIEALPTGGFTVRAFTERDIYDAIELRGTLEGLAARLAAERGAKPEKLDALKACVTDIDALLVNGEMSADLMSAYVGLNGAFHTLIAELPESPGVVRQIERVVSLPFASASAFVMAQVGLPQARAVLALAQEHHKGVIEAIEGRQGARAESLMREHARLAHRNLQFVLHDKEWLERIPGGALIERSGLEAKAPKGKGHAP